MASASVKKKAVAISIKDSVQFSQLEIHLDDSGRLIILICEINKVVYTLVNIYLSGKKAPPSARDMLFFVGTLTPSQIKTWI